MNFLSLLLKLGMLKTLCVCRDDCKRVNASNYHLPQVQHISTDLQESSVAPWSLNNDFDQGREPSYIYNAKCDKCSLTSMEAKPIHIRIQVYHKIKDCPFYMCRCPYEMAVGCTCVNK